MTAATPPTSHPRPVVLCILDGFGERAERADNATLLANAPNISALRKGPHTLISTSGPDVGLPKGQMGNSEVGHLNFGAGRIALMDISRIDNAVADGEMLKNEVIANIFNVVKHNKCRLHLFGLLSDGGVHSSLTHLFALINAAHLEEIPVVVHAFLDGRDTPPQSAGKYLDELEAVLEDGKKGVIGTISGRYYAMDRDKRWDRVIRGYRAIVRGEALHAKTAKEALSQAYAKGHTDEFVEPTRIGDYTGLKGDFVCDFAGGDGKWRWVGEEAGFAFNFRPDRMREISAMFIRKNLPPEAEALLLDRDKAIIAFPPGTYATMTEYDEKLDLPVAFRKDNIEESFGEVVARAGLKQFRCAETEKYAHVTYFFNGGREEPFDGEDRKLVPSPRDVATYDLKPEMSAAEVSASVVTAVESGKYDVVVVNFANPDMVGHTGNLDAAIRAVEAVDRGLGPIIEAVTKAHGALLVTADHGNCEQMKDDQGRPHTAHTTNPVPLFYVNDAAPNAVLRSGGRICDVAPTLLKLLGLPQPDVMTGQTLIAE